MIHKFDLFTHSIAHMPSKFLKQKSQNHVAAFIPLETILGDLFIFFCNGQSCQIRFINHGGQY